MNSVLQKTFGGLSPQYYIRHFLFGLIFPAFIFSMSTSIPNPTSIILLIVNALLYPYSRFVYESIVDFIMGENVFFVNPMMLLLVKSFTMLICFMLAIFIAPVGLAYLYYHHSKATE